MMWYKVGNLLIGLVDLAWVSALVFEALFRPTPLRHCSVPLLCRYNPLLRLLSLPFSFLACLLSPLASCVCRLNPLSWFRKQPKIQLLTMEVQ